ncbi:MAG: DNRLRE domain-containing protein, partial [Candidatus Bathyarchaeota archaeon]
MSKLSLWLITLILFSVFTGIVFVSRVNSEKVVGSDIVTLSPIADSYVNQSSPDTNYGSETRLKIECNDYYRYAYMMFDLSSLPLDATIIEAKLRLTLRTIEGYGEWGVTIGVHYCPDDSWNEADITWNSKPSFASEPTDTERFWFVFLPSTDSWNVTVDVQTAFASDKKLTEVVLVEEPKTAWGWASFESREVGGVELEIEYTT